MISDDILPAVNLMVPSDPVAVFHYYSFSISNYADMVSKRSRGRKGSQFSKSSDYYMYQLRCLI